MAIYSIGSTCLPRLGFDEYFGNRASLFYDWLITDLPSLESSLLRFNENKFFRMGYEVCDESMRVKELHSGLRFQHDFPSIGSKVCQSSLEASLDQVRTRYIRRKNRLDFCISKDKQPTFIRYERSLEDSECTSLLDYEAKLRSLLLQAYAKSFELIIISPEIKTQQKIGSSYFIPVELVPQQCWRAQKKSWDRIATCLRSIYRPMD